MLDDIETFLHSKGNIDKDTNFLISYITSHLFAYSNREKIEQFYTKFPEIFDRLLGISNKTYKSNKYNHVQNSLIDQLSEENVNFIDFSRLIHNFIPLENKKNMFSAFYSPPDGIPSYKISAQIIGKTVNSLLKEQLYESLIKLYPLFSLLSKPIDIQISNLKKNLLVLNIYEYFIIFFLLSIKELNYIKLRINLKEVNRNFRDFNSLHMNISSRNDMEKSLMVLQEIDSTKSLAYNFFYISFKQYILYFAQSNIWSDYEKLKILISAIDFVWLSDYQIIKNINKNTAEEYTTHFNTLKSITTSGFIPNILLLDCLFFTIKTLQSRYLLFTEFQKNPKSKEESLLLKIQKPLFYFLKSCFIRFSSESMNSESSLFDIARIWFKYITPWIESSSQSYNKSYMGDNRINDNLFFESFIYNNLLFYTELFNDYLVSFSQLSSFKNNEIIQLSEILQLYEMESSHIINGVVKISELEDLSSGKAHSSNLIDAENHIRSIGSQRNNVNPFKDNENKKNINVIVNTLSTLLYKLRSQSSNLKNDEEMASLTQTLNRIQNILILLYKIDKNENYEKKFLNNSEQIDFQRNASRLYLRNPWEKKRTNDESSILYFLLKSLSYKIDDFRKIPHLNKNDPPHTNLRYFCNYYNLISLGVLFLLVYLFIKIFMNVISN